ncbi:MAG: transglycosylase domain-containing protein [Bacteroidales bacterium]|nr:transglycosylase domain-containing protein [Bacteroidales bacterium]MBN2761898.1 transglycosylase domain-containing protein [Bacteroidales bacterium]
MKRLFQNRFSGRIILMVIIFTGILLFILFVSLRNIVFERKLNSLAGKFETLGYHLSWKDNRVTHLNKISVGKIKLVAETDSTIVEADSLTLQFSLLSAVHGLIGIKDLSCRNVSLLYDNKNSNGTAVSEEELHGSEKANYAANVYRLMHNLFSIIPEKLIVDNIRALIHNTCSTDTLNFHRFKLSQGRLQSFLQTGADSLSTFMLEGKINKKIMSGQLLLYRTGKNSCTFSLQRRYPFRAGFDTLMVSFSFPDNSPKLVTIEGTSVLKGFTLDGDRLALTTIFIDRLLSSFIFQIKPRSVELDSSSVLIINDISMHPYLSVLTEPQLAAKMKIIPVKWDAGVFFQSLPRGMFTSLIGMKASGNLRFFLDFSLDMSMVDSLHFASSLTADDFQIMKYGVDDYRLLNNEFVHDFYDGGRLAASFAVGPSNPDFVPLADISAWLKTSVLTSEDGSFYHHKGFNQRAIRESVIANIKEKKFIRGGSTITMQLVKNVFLTRNKTLGRKLEELLIVWIIENNRLVSKERLFEVYLNIIEWGPDIYGVSQASQYYFNKQPANLNLQESLFLAGIIPFPKRFKSVFESNGYPRTYFSAYMQRMKELMVARNYILPDDTLDVDQHVFLTGPASQVFVSPDTVKADSVMPEELPALPALKKVAEQ